MPPSPDVSTPPLSRRGLLAAGGTLGLGLVATACGVRGGTRTGGAGSWSFTDDRGRRATADGRPRHVVAYISSAAALYDFGVDERLVGVFGPTSLPDGRPDPLAGELDLKGRTVLGTAWGEFSLEKYAALKPDLLVSTMFEPPTLWYVPEDSAEQIEKLAPSVGIDISKTRLPEPISRYAELAVALGADPKATRVTSARARFDRAVDALRQAAQAAAGITVLAAAARADLFYVADPAVYSDLNYYRDLGVRFVTPTNVTDGFYENLSWENADHYPADLILLDSRTGALQPDALADKPSWARLPAVRAGQVIPWESEPRLSYAGCAPHVEALATALRAARGLT